MLDTFASLPGWMQLSTKALIAGPAAYHTINGFRHLAWDTGYRTFCSPQSSSIEERKVKTRPAARSNLSLSIVLNLKTSYMAGYVVLGATAVSTVGLLAL
jgi:succinate dehydrogenase (ubiquinone) cytochrome b560 subunit